MKTLAGALFAFFAGGLLASASALAAHEYFASLTSVTATGENHTFTAGEAVITCKKAEFKWNGLEGAHAVLDVTPAYKECKVSGTSALVTVEKAQFEFGIPGTEPKKGEFTMPAAIIGESTAKIKVTALLGSEKCEVNFPVQKLMGETTHFLNLGETGGEVQAKIEGIEYKSNSKCNGKVGEKGTNGKYEGSGAETGIVVK